MPLTKLQFKPGVNRETTSYTNDGGWFDCDKVRFRFGLPEKIGGWTKLSGSSFLGTCRALHPWVTLAGTSLLGVGTHLKYYINEGGGYNDITPIRQTTTPGDITFSVPLTTLSQSRDADDVTIKLTSASGFPSSGFIKIGSEEIFYAGISGANLVNCLRGQKGTTAASHSSGATVSCATITVTDTDHNALENDFVTFTNCVTLGGNITADVLNQEYQIQTVLTANTYTVNTRTAGTTLSSITVSGQIDDTLVYGNSSDTGTGTFTDSTVDTTNGDATVTMNDTSALVLNAPISGTGIPSGAIVLSLTDATTFEMSANATASNTNITMTVNTCTAAYQINTGLDTTVSGTGWGAGTWGRGAWGSASSLTAGGSTLRIWSHDNFGEDLIINVRDSGIYYWDATNTVSARAVELKDLVGANSSTPTVAKQVLVSDRDRHVIAFGCDSEFSTEQDPLLIRFSAQESITDWEATATNDAGDLRLGTGSEIIAATETRQQILVWTDVSLHAMQYLGPPFTFGISLISENITINGPLSVIAVDDTVYWMGAEEFYVYTGSVQRLPCTIRDYIFNDFNSDQAEKVTASINSSFGEIWWFYPSQFSQENDRYAVYNYQQQIWYYGTLPRTCWIDRGVSTEPIAAGDDGYLYLQEFGLDDGSTSPVSPITSYIESSQMDLGDGEQFSFIRRMIPDLTFRDSSAAVPVVEFTLKTRLAPGGPYTQTQTGSVVKFNFPASDGYSSDFTEQVHLRLRGRSFALRVESDISGVAWRLGSPRIDVRPDGRR